ncbi:MAG: GNAT family N-acetyltransferase [Chloroflexota bacterium]
MSIITDELRSQFDTHLRKHFITPDVERDATDKVVRYWVANEKMGFVLHSDLSADDDLNAIIQAQLAYFKDKGAEAIEWKHYDYDAPDTLPMYLLKNGLQPDEREAVMVLEIASAPDALKATPTHDIRKVTDATMLEDADRVHNAIWEGKRTASERVLAMWDAAPNSVSVHIAYVDDKPVSYGRVEFPAGEGNPFASIWAGATLPEYRQRGIYTQLVAARLQEAEERGYAYLTVDAMPNTSMPILQKRGFERLAFATGFVWSSGDE